MPTRSRENREAGVCVSGEHLWIEGQRRCRKCRKESDREYRFGLYQNDAEFRKAKCEYERTRREDNIQVRLIHNLRSRLSTAVKRGYKAGSAVNDLGCSIEQLKLWFMYQFQPGMTWDNYGEWEIDHVIPLSSFDLTDRAQLLEACNWFNLQPLWKLDNQIKGAK